MAISSCSEEDLTGAIDDTTDPMTNDGDCSLTPAEVEGPFPNQILQ